MRRSEAGFTLIELLIVLMIIAVLVAVAVSSFLGFESRARDATAKSNLREALPAVHAFYADENTWSGMTVARLEADYDRGLPDITIVRSDATSYCLSSTSGDRTWFAAGPPLTLSQTSCA